MLCAEGREDTALFFQDLIGLGSLKVFTSLLNTHINLWTDLWVFTSV